MELQRISRLHLSPSTSTRGPGDKLGGPENCSPAFLQELVGRNRFLKLLSSQLYFQVLLDLSSYINCLFLSGKFELSNEMLCLCSVAARVS